MKRHIENLQWLLLAEIYKRYSSRSGTSLNAFIKNELKEDDGDIEMTRNIKKDLEELEQRNILTWEAEPMQSKGNNFPESKKFKSLLGSDINNTFKYIYVEVKLTPDKGLDYASHHVNVNTTLSINKSMKLLTYGLLIITGIGVLVQMRQCCISDRQSSRDTKSQLTNSQISPTVPSVPMDEPKINKNPHDSTISSNVATSTYSKDTAQQKDTTHKLK